MKLYTSDNQGQAWQEWGSLRTVKNHVPMLKVEVHTNTPHPSRFSVGFKQKGGSLEFCHERIDLSPYFQAPSPLAGCPMAEIEILTGP